MKINQGDKFKVKATPANRKYGVRCGSSDSHDCKVWPGEIGEIRIYPGNGWLEMEIVFERFRTVQIDTFYFDTEDWSMDDSRMVNFKKVR